MTFWLILAAMTALALGAVIWPLARARKLPATGSDLAVYRDQLEEIERDRADGRIGDEEFEAARVEVSRRLLTAAHKGVPAADAGSRRRRLATLAIAAALIPLLAVPLYALLGSPELPGEPFAGRAAEAREQANNVAAMIARIEARLEEDPADGRGWEVLAPVYMRLERYDDAVKARHNALRLLGETPARDVDLGEALTAQAGGVVTAAAKAAFDSAIALDPNDFKAMFYLGLAAEQDGKSADAAAIWRSLIAKAPADAPWLPVVQQALQRVEGSPAEAAQRSAPGPRQEDIAAAAGMTPEQRNQMIRGMVDQLASRLHQDGSDVEGWLRLLRAYMVLGDHDKAKAAAGEARAALAGAPDKLRRLDDAIRDLGVDG